MNLLRSNPRTPAEVLEVDLLRADLWAEPTPAETTAPDAPEDFVGEYIEQGHRVVVLIVDRRGREHLVHGTVEETDPDAQLALVSYRVWSTWDRRPVIASKWATAREVALYDAEAFADVPAVLGMPVNANAPAFASAS